jgi:hypothetical protein
MPRRPCLGSFELFIMTATQGLPGPRLPSVSGSETPPISLLSGQTFGPMYRPTRPDPSGPD